MPMTPGCVHDCVLSGYRCDGPSSFHGVYRSPRALGFIATESSRSQRPAWQNPCQKPSDANQQGLSRIYGQWHGSELGLDVLIALSLALCLSLSLCGGATGFGVRVGEIPKVRVT